jgi:signal transduction histidine kinase
LICKIQKNPAAEVPGLHSHPAAADDILKFSTKTGNAHYTQPPEKTMPYVIDNITTDLLHKLANCLQEGEERLMDKVLEYAIQHGYSKYTSTLKEAWRISITGLTGSFANALGDPGCITELGPDQDYRSDPVAAFGIHEARLHRARGVRLDMFLGLLKYYRQAYHEIAQAEVGSGAAEKETCRCILDRLFDRVEIGFCTEWAASGTSHLDELQAVNRAMTNEKNKFLTIFESIPFPVILLDECNQIDNRNHAASLWLGGHGVPGACYYGAKCELKSKDTCQPRTVEAMQTLPEWLVPEVEKFSARRDLQYDYLQKEVQVGEDPLLYFVQLSKMMDISGKFEGSVIMVQDFTAARNAEEERTRMKAQLLQSEKMASIGQLAAGVAHEINNPIGFIASNLNRLEEYAADLIHLVETYGRLAAAVEKPDPGEPELKSVLAKVREAESSLDMNFLCEDIQTVIQECQEGADRVRRIVADLKDFAHPGVTAPQYADINRCLASTLNMLRNELKYKVTLEKDFGQIPEISCHPHQLNQVFVNLIVNAAQAIENSGTIRISTRKKGDFIRIRITDSGCGMTAEQAKRAFEPFYTTKPVGTGTGMGLYIAFQVIEQHKGEIAISSQPGRGTTFTINLPLETARAETEPASG